MSSSAHPGGGPPLATLLPAAAKLADRSAGSAFDAACTVVVNYLQSVSPMGMWAVTRVVEDRQLMLVIDPPDYPLEVGTELAFATSLCARMLATGQPLIVADIHTHPATTDFVAPDGLTVRSYTGAAIQTPDGGVFGTLCGWSRRPQPALTDADAALLQVFATLLSALLQADLAVTEAHRDTERAQLLSDTDELTGLLNRRGWNRYLALEEQRHRRFGDPAGIITLDIDGLKHVNDTFGHHAGDDLIRRTAQVLTAQTRGTDVLARLGGDEFGVIAVGAATADTTALTDRIRRALHTAGIAASIGHAAITLKAGYQHAWQEADQRMYQEKHHRG